MTTVVRKDEFLRAKKAVMDNLTGARGDIILQGVLFKYQPDTAGSVAFLSAFDSLHNESKLQPLASSGSAAGSSSDNSSQTFFLFCYNMYCTTLMCYQFVRHEQQHKLAKEESSSLS